jgi:hypothetical protein
MENEYFNRWLEIKKLVEADANIMQNIELSFKNAYQDFWSNQIPLLGAGTAHVHFGVGKVFSPSFKEDIHLMMRLNESFPPMDEDFYSKEYLSMQLQAFESAFFEKIPTRYFVGVVNSNLLGYDDRILGIITEDVGKGGIYRVETMPSEEMGELTSLDGTITRIYLDPDIGLYFPEDKVVIGEKYLDKSAMLYLK